MATTHQTKNDGSQLLADLLKVVEFQSPVVPDVSLDGARVEQPGGTGGRREERGQQAV